jgi:quinol monooxygenase YgiN
MVASSCLSTFRESWPVRLAPTRLRPKHARTAARRGNGLEEARREEAKPCLSYWVSLDSSFTKASSTSTSADTYFNDDRSECVVIERYRDSEAAIEHAANLRDLSEAILATVSVVHGEVLGEPSAELRANLADSEVPQLFTPLESM